MRFALTTRFGLATWFTVLGTAIAIQCGCKQDNATTSGAATPNAVDSSAANSGGTGSGVAGASTEQNGSVTHASIPSASEEEARKLRESGQKNDPGASAVGRPMNPDKFGPQK